MVVGEVECPAPPVTHTRNHEPDATPQLHIMLFHICLMAVKLGHDAQGYGADFSIHRFRYCIFRGSSPTH